MRPSRIARSSSATCDAPYRRGRLAPRPDHDEGAHGSDWKSKVLGRPRYDTDTELVGRFDSIAELEQLEEERAGRLRYVMLTHNNDAVAYFGLDLFLSCPPWLGLPETRPSGVPRTARYGPVVTFLQTLVDMKTR
jgi:uncharacterized membrane protein